MAFVNTAAVTGVPEFGIIHINAAEVAKALTVYLETGSKLTGVSLDDINLNVTKAPTDQTTVTLTDLLGIGMKLFDAIVWLSAGRPDKYPLKTDPSMEKSKLPTMHEIAKSVFYCFFMLVTQARYPASKNDPAKPAIANFLRILMGLDKEQHVYVEMICSFPPQQFDPAWARHVKFSGFGQEVLSRFGLGVAGYRMFAPFALYQPKSDLSGELNNAYQFARAVALAPATWDIHPLTRNPDILKRRGNLNKNLGNLMLEVFSKEQLEEMKTSKVIYDIPKREAAHLNYKTWASTDDISGATNVFSSI